MRVIVYIELLFGLVFFLLIIPFVWWLLWEFSHIDYAIRVSKPLIPELELVVKNNIVDTIYVYHP